MTASSYSETWDEVRARQSRLTKKSNEISSKIELLQAEHIKVEAELRDAAKKVAKWKFEQLSPSDYSANPHLLENLIKDAWQGGREHPNALEAFNTFLASFDSRLSAFRWLGAGSFSIRLENTKGPLEPLAQKAEEVAKFLLIAQGLESITIEVFSDTPDTSPPMLFSYSQDGTALEIRPIGKGKTPKRNFLELLERVRITSY